jgi:hypothetical protein
MPLSSRLIAQCAFALAMVGAPLIAASCARGATVSPTNGEGSSSGSVGGGNSGGVHIPTGSSGVASGGNKCTQAAPCNDFASVTPIMDPAGTPSSNPASAFGSPTNGSTSNGPCLAEPADGSLVPKNWLRPRVVWKAGSGETVFEVRFSSVGETQDLVVYTTNTYYTMDEGLWQQLAWTAPDGGAAIDGSLINTPITVTVRGISGTGGTPGISNSATFTIAPAIADGALVYWTTENFDNSATNTTLQGFHVGDEGTTTALTSNQVQQQVRAQPSDGGNLTGNFQQVYCIGCHTATPDGNYVAFTAQWPWPSTIASIQQGQAGAVPPWMSRGAVQNLSPDYRGNPYDTWYNPPAVNQIMLGIGTFSPAHYQTGDRKYVATLGTSWNSFSLSDPGVPSGVTSQLAWFNLEWDDALTAAGQLEPNGLPAATPCTVGTYPGINGATQGCLPTPVSNGGWGIIARNGDSNGAGSPSWSHNVANVDAIAYSSTNVGVKDGRMDCASGTVPCTSAIAVVPYNGGNGGNVVKLPGASDPAFNEYYPAWSPDDLILAFNRVPAGTSMYNEAEAEVWVVPFSDGNGGTPVAVTSTFPPPSCTNPFPSGVQNTWPKWAPNPLDANGNPASQVDAAGNTYYWLTFSSIRSPQAAIDTSNGGKRKQQLYLAGLVVDKNGNAKSFAPVYMWNQNALVNNLIPAWGEFTIPNGTTTTMVQVAQ